MTSVDSFNTIILSENTDYIKYEDPGLVMNNMI